MRAVQFIAIRTNGVDIDSVLQIDESQVAGMLDPPDANLHVYAVALVGGVMRIAVATVGATATPVGTLNSYNIIAAGQTVGTTQKIIDL